MSLTEKETESILADALEQLELEKIDARMYIDEHPELSEEIISLLYTIDAIYELDDVIPKQSFRKKLTELVTTVLTLTSDVNHSPF